ncbi:MAG: QueT transporter family protein [Clostridia bacterium]|nr:QueT transporter family protein [Clostridia bacterium]
MHKTATLRITQVAVVTAAYVLLTLPFAQFAFGPIQFRLAEAMAVLPAVFPAAIPGLFLGCLLANLFNPNNLGPIDIVFGSLATLLAGYATWHISRMLRSAAPIVRRLACLAPPIVINALVVGTYLPFLLLEEGGKVTLGLAAFNILTVGLSEAVVVFLVGLPLLAALEKKYPVS